MEIRAYAALLRAAEKDPDFPLVHRLEQFFPLRVRVGVVDERDLVRVHARRDELFADVAVYAPLAPLRRALIAEDDLRPLFLCRPPVNIADGLNTFVDFGIRFVLCGRDITPWTERKFLPVRRES